MSDNSFIELFFFLYTLFQSERDEYNRKKDLRFKEASIFLGSERRSA